MPWLTVGAANGLLVVMLGAFGAHALRARLTPELLTIYETGIRYHAYHALALLAVGLWVRVTPDPRWAHRAGWMMLLGIVVFSGSLYTLALTGVRALGRITPVGGLALLLGWAFLLVSAAGQRA